jgi:hypothetical protein
MDPGVLPMADTTSRLHPKLSGCTELDPDEFARAIRQLATDTYRTLKCRNSRAGELIELAQRFEHLISSMRGSPATELDHWLRSAYHLIQAKIHANPQTAEQRRNGRFLPTARSSKSPARPTDALAIARKLIRLCYKRERTVSR